VSRLAYLCLSAAFVCGCPKSPAPESPPAEQAPQSIEDGAPGRAAPSTMKREIAECVGKCETSCMSYEAAEHSQCVRAFHAGCFAETKSDPKFDCGEFRLGKVKTEEEGHVAEPAPDPEKAEAKDKRAVLQPKLELKKEE